MRSAAAGVVGRILVGVVTAALALPGSVAAQQHLSGGNEGKRPIGWQVLLEGRHAAGNTVSFVQMTPGFHVTTGPPAILWHPDSTARGTYSVASTIFLFPTNDRSREGYGVFVGGAELSGSGQRYTYFLLHNDGGYRINQVRAGETVALRDWTPLPAIRLQAGADAARNDIRVDVGPEQVTFLVNGVQAAQLPRATVQPDGVFGVRVNHAVDAHVSNIGRPAPGK